MISTKINLELKESNVTREDRRIFCIINNAQLESHLLIPCTAGRLAAKKCKGHLPPGQSEMMVIRTCSLCAASNKANFSSQYPTRGYLENQVKWLTRESHFYTEHIWLLPFSGKFSHEAWEEAPVTNLISCKQWVKLGWQICI